MPSAAPSAPAMPMRGGADVIGRSPYSLETSIADLLAAEADPRDLADRLVAQRPRDADRREEVRAPVGLRAGRPDADPVPLGVGGERSAEAHGEDDRRGHAAGGANILGHASSWSVMTRPLRARRPVWSGPRGGYHRPAISNNRYRHAAFSRRERRRPPPPGAAPGGVARPRYRPAPAVARGENRLQHLEHVEGERRPKRAAPGPSRTAAREIGDPEHAIVGPVRRGVGPVRRAVERALAVEVLPLGAPVRERDGAAERVRVGQAQ